MCVNVFKHKVAYPASAVKIIASILCYILGVSIHTKDAMNNSVTKISNFSSKHT